MNTSPVNGSYQDFLRDEAKHADDDYTPAGDYDPGWKNAARITTPKVSITAQCVGCRYHETFTEPDIPIDVPMCTKCFSPMVVVLAEKK